MDRRVQGRGEILALMQGGAALNGSKRTPKPEVVARRRRAAEGHAFRGLASDRMSDRLSAAWRIRMAKASSTSRTAARARIASLTRPAEA